MTETLRVGVIGTDNSHAYTYCAFLNGWAEDVAIPYRLSSGVSAPDMYLWAMTLRTLEDRQPQRVPVPGARASKIWSESRRDAERLARACSIDHVCDDPGDATRDVDAVMVLSESSESHLELARPALEAGLATYIDKPMAPSATAAAAIFDLASGCGAPCFSASALRFDPRLQPSSVGVHSIYVSCPLGFRLYGIHALELVDAFLGHEVSGLAAIRAADRDVVLLEYPDGRNALLDNLHRVRDPRYRVTAHDGTGTEHTWSVDDVGSALLGLVEEFVRFANTGDAPVKPSRTLALIALQEQAAQALEESKAIPTRARGE